ncbi:MAG: ArsR family transcriptional regulator [Flavobacterium sp.]
MLPELITSKTRLRLLVKFFINASNHGYLRGLATEMQENTNAIRKELNHLSEAGYLEKEEIGNKVSYKANTQHPLFGLLQQIIHKYMGLDVLVETILSRMGVVEQIWLVGDYAEGRDTGSIEVVIVGADLNQAYIEQLAPKIAQEIGKQVVLIPVKAFQEKGLLLFEV